MHHILNLEERGKLQSQKYFANSASEVITNYFIPSASIASTSSLALTASEVFPLWLKVYSEKPPIMAASYANWKKVVRERFRDDQSQEDWSTNRCREAADIIFSLLRSKLKLKFGSSFSSKKRYIRNFVNRASFVARKFLYEVDFNFQPDHTRLEKQFYKLIGDVIPEVKSM